MKYLILFLISFDASAASVIFDTTDIVGSISGLGTAAIAICGAMIIFAITVLVYKRIKSLLGPGISADQWRLDRDNINQELKRKGKWRNMEVRGE